MIAPVGPILTQVGQQHLSASSLHQNHPMQAQTIGPTTSSSIFPNSMSITQFPYAIQNQPQYNSTNRKSLTWARSSSSTVSDQDSEILTFILNGGPKWNFRIRQLNNSKRVVVSAVFKGPAEKAGLKVNDEVLCVNNVPLYDEPRSLLLSDHPEQQQHLTSALMSISGGGSDENKSPSTCTEQVLGSDGVLRSARGPAAPTIELSKLDFAYQLIKHSSASNKLVLTIKRYKNQQQFAQLNSDYNQNRNQAGSQANNMRSGKLHSIGSVHYSYKCCECYCDNEGKFL